MLRAFLYLLVDCCTQCLLMIMSLCRSIAAYMTLLRSCMRGSYRWSQSI